MRGSLVKDTFSVEHLLQYTPPRKTAPPTHTHTFHPARKSLIPDKNVIVPIYNVLCMA